MKKLLGLLAVAPMAIAACGGSTDTTAKADHVAYFAGHGINTGNNGDNGAHNTWGAVIESSVFDADGVLTYNIEESNGGVMDFKDVMTAAATDITPNWELSVDSVVDGVDVPASGITGKHLLTLGFTEDSTTTAIVDAEDKFYNNIGDSLRYLYDIIELKDFDRATSLVDGKDSDTVAEFVNKDASYGNNDSFFWMSNKLSWENYLGRVYGTCALAEAVTATELTAYAAFKGDEPGKVAGATAGETGLYIAAGIKTAQAHCAE